MENLLHYIWKHKLYSCNNNFKTIDETPIEIIDVGVYNTNAGPDFFNAKIKIGEEMWAGNVEIHIKSSDWYKHHHDKDKAYNSVVLHIVEFVDEPIVKDSNGRIIPQWIMQVPNKIKENYSYLLYRDSLIPCAEQLWKIPEIFISDWKVSLLTERLERKVGQIVDLLSLYKNNWDEVFYVLLSRNFGFGVNSDAFERLAKSLPLICVYKHSDSILQTEALFLGQAGLLNDDIDDSYYSSLKIEYKFLAKKYNLQGLDSSSSFKSLRMRPGNFPYVKLVQLASIIRQSPRLFSKILDLKDLNEMQFLFTTDIHKYWNTHYNFGKPSVDQVKTLGLSSVNILIINTVVPILFAYGRHTNNENYIDSALKLLDLIRPESNYIVKAFTKYGVAVNNAGDSQALIQLQREYCEKKKCIFCRIGNKLFTT
ncbi:hypothetical protein M2138_000517 [Dysgonomonadaceae bacterium PH5-43]|nr:hypothetical protein [Dysgonomonadaceae bacterium PH5-43]